MKNVRRVWLACSLCAFALSTPPTATAHHSSAGYDFNQAVTINGTLKKYEWANPHVYVYVEETTPGGGTIEWEIECGPPSLMRRLGWGRDSLKIGDTLTIRGFPSKDTQHRSLFPNLVQRGDRTLFSFQDFAKLHAPTTAARASGLAGVWSTAVNPKTLAIATSPAEAQLTKKGVEALRAFDERTTPTSACVPVPAPSSIIMPDLKRIAFRDGNIYFETETLGSSRTIHMNRTTHEGATPSLQGHSIGKWEADTLVIDTTHFSSHGAGNGGGNGIGRALPSGPSKHLIERLVLNADGRTLSYRFELTDPEYLAAPKTGELLLHYTPQAPFEIEPCDLDVARRFMKQ